MDYDALYKRLWQAVAANDQALAGDMQAFIRQFLLRLRSEGWELSGDAETALNSYLSSIETALKSSIAAAVAVGFGLPVTAAALRSEAVLQAAERAFSERWPDGLKLSDRLWNWQDSTRTGIQDVLKQGVRLGESTGKTLYAMQRAIERTNGGQRFKIVENHIDDWVTELHQSAQALIHNPAAGAQWQTVVDDAEARIAGLAKTGSRHAAERVLSQIKAAVDKGREDLLDNAVKWWTYDKQLYGLKRIARTEMATAAHRAVIASAIDDPDIIGFQWRLSASHPATDICDYYANIEMGLGKGVFTKEAVPRHKAHPHCMCLLIPRTTPIKQKGDRNYADFIRNTSEERRDQLLPKWTKNLMALGTPLDKLLRSDGLGLVTRESLKQRLGDEKFNALDALGKALADKKWPENKLKLKMPQTRESLAALEANSQVPEVKAFLAKLEQTGHRIGSREWHYFRYKYYFGDELKSPNDLDRRFDAVLGDKNAMIYKPGERYAIYSPTEGRVAYVHPSGGRVSVYQPNKADLEKLGDPLWTIHSLND